MFYELSRGELWANRGLRILSGTGFEVTLCAKIQICVIG